MRWWLCAAAGMAGLLFVSAASAQPVVPPPPEPDVKADPRYKANVEAVAKASDGTQIFGKLGPAIDVPAPSTVAIFGAGKLCTGVLIAPNAVLTAKHCVCARVSERVVFGQDANKPDETIPVSTRKLRWGPCQPTNGSDLALLILERDAKASPVRILPAAAETATYDALRAIGYGLTEDGESGKAYFTDIIVAAPKCSAADASLYGCAVDRELVAGKFDGHADTCRGDSGGPMFRADANGGFSLAAITSRAVRRPGAKLCGDGGIYALLAKEALDWIAESGVKVSMGQ